jgi:hypothetical protein
MGRRVFRLRALRIALTLLGQNYQRLALLDDVRRKLCPRAAADVLRSVVHAGRNEQDAAAMLLTTVSMATAMRMRDAFMGRHHVIRRDASASIIRSVSVHPACLDFFLMDTCRNERGFLAVSSRTNYRLRGIKEVRAAGCFRRTVAGSLSTPSHNHYPRTAVMNSRLFLIPAILATVAAFSASADEVSAPPDASAQAVALLSGVHVGHGAETAVKVTQSAVESDAHAQAAALLRGVHVTNGAETAVKVTRSAVESDAHAQAAALLSG